MSTRWSWFKTACDIAEMLHGEPQDQRPAIMAQLLMDVQDEMEAGPGNRAKMRDQMERSFRGGGSSGGPQREGDTRPLYIVEDDG